MSKKMCAYVGCKRGILNQWLLCPEHFNAEKEGIINKCPGCGRYKNARYELCYECDKKGNIAISVKEERESYDKRHFVYILKSEDGDYYVGNTDNLRVRMVEHRDGKASEVTKNKNYELVYFEFADGKEMAKKREADIKGLVEKRAG